MKRKIVAILTLCVLLCASIVGFAACSVVEDIKTKTLSAPTIVRIENSNLCWNPVEYASGYTVSIDNREYPVEGYQYPLTSMTDGEHVFKVKANGDGILYASSGWSEALTKSFVEGAVSNNFAYGEFENANENESYLGYGFDVINSSVFSDKYVKMSYPIFKIDKLMNQRLLKVDSKQTYVEEVKSSSMDTFLQEWNANAHVNVSWGGKRLGGSVDASVKYSGGVENASSVYYHSMSLYNQEFYIVMQGDTNTYKSILSDGFMTDLYSDMSPAELFDKYGTHFITSAVMGGRINSYYLYSSTEQKTYHDISAKVSTEVRAWKAANTKVDVSAGYMQEANSQNIYIENMLEVIGGGDFGMLADTDIAGNYGEWEKSLDKFPALMGIKDTSSLVPLWNLIDASKDTKIYTFTTPEGIQTTGNRAEQLQAYFYKYGLDEYNNLMSSAGLPELVAPESITNVRINNQEPKNDEYEVYTGVGNDITFTVTPDNAIGYTKSASLSVDSDFATIENRNGLSLVIDPNCPHNSVFQVVLSAGSVREIVNVRVIKRYTVDFETNGGTEVVAIKNIRHGSQIDEPTSPTKTGWIFKGWYLDPDFAEGSLYKFGQSSVKENFTLYAKWEKFYPEITFVHNVAGCEKVNDYVEAGKAYPKPTDLTTESHEVKGFYANAEMIIPFDFTQPIKTNTTIYVKWEPKQFTITFDSMGGSSVDKITNVVWGTKVNEPNQPKREGYVFDGWYMNKNFQIEDQYSFILDEVKENLTLYAKWERFYPEITFVHNAVGSTLLKDTIEYNKVYTNPGVLTLEGHNFIGYYSDKEMKNSFDFTQPIKTNTTIYVKWALKQYTVTFNSVGGTKVNSIFNVDWGTKITEPTQPTKAGYVFGNWYKDSTYNYLFDFNQDLIKEDTTLYAQWLEDPIIIYFEENGGQEVDDRKILKGDSLGNKLPNVTKVGYTFEGWYLTEEFNTSDKVNSNTVFTKNTTLYAKWSKWSYTIKYDSNQPECGCVVSGSMSDTNCTYGAAYNLRTNGYSVAGHSFKGWATSPDGQVVYKNAQIISNIMTENNQVIILYAIWDTNEYTITLDSNGGELSSTSIKVKYHDAYNLPIPTLQGNDFLGWYDGSIKYESGKWDKTDNVILVAKWSKKWNYTIIYDDNRPECDCVVNGIMGSTECVYGDTYNLEKNNYSIDGHSFKGWATSSDGQVVYNDEQSVTNIMTENNQVINLYAVWDTNKYSITLLGFDGAPIVYDIRFHDAFELPIMSKVGYVFDGWYDNNGTKYDKGTWIYPYNVNLIPKWTQRTYTITFNANGGSVSQGSKSVLYDGTYGTLPTPTRTDYAFVGWYTTKNSGVKIESFTTFNSVNNITLYAHWVEINYVYQNIRTPDTVQNIGFTNYVEKISFSGLSSTRLNELKNLGYTNITLRIEFNVKQVGSLGHLEIRLYKGIDSNNGKEISLIDKFLIEQSCLWHCTVESACIVHDSPSSMSEKHYLVFKFSVSELLDNEGVFKIGLSFSFNFCELGSMAVAINFTK